MERETSPQISEPAIIDTTPELPVTEADSFAEAILEPIADPLAEGRPLVISHRGNGHGKENTVTALCGAIEYGADGIETDVRLGDDGELFLYHDYRIEGKPPESLTPLERTALGIEPLEDLLINCEEWPGKVIQLEAKTVAAAEAILERVPYREEYMLISFSDHAVRLALAAGWSAGYLHTFTEQTMVDLAPSGAYYGPQTALAQNIDNRLLTNSLVWCVNDQPTAKTLIERGAYGLVTDRLDDILPLFS